MSRDINKVILCGTLGRDPEFKDFDRSRLGKFSLATTDEAFGDKEKSVTWHDVAVWGKLTDVVAQLRKGSRVLVEGRNNVRLFKDGNGIQRKIHEVVAISVTPLSSLGDAQPALFGDDEAPQEKSASRSRPAAERSAQSRIAAEPPSNISDDEIPF